MSADESEGDEKSEPILETQTIIVKKVSRKTTIFDIYAKTFCLLLSNWFPQLSLIEEERRNTELDELILPSNTEWRHQVYYKLVELQRQIDVGIKHEDTSVQPKMKSSSLDDWQWYPESTNQLVRGKIDQSQETMNSLLAISSIGGSMTEAYIQPGWRMEDILLAAQVLQRNFPSPCYANEAEMRRVFGLVYDVLRSMDCTMYDSWKYSDRVVLNRALEDVAFWSQNNVFKKRERIVWLLLYDMQMRKFTLREGPEVIQQRENIFKDAGLKVIEDALLEKKIHLAASLSRLRIAGSALTLDKLLPRHLRSGEGVVWGDNGAIASGWINTNNLTKGKAEFIEEMLTKLGLELCQDCNTVELDENVYVFDPICPKMINLHEKAREKLAISDLVRDHQFILLERSLCLGAATLAHVIRAGRLCGPVILTHSIAPRHTGYLAGLLAEIEGSGKLLSFGAGDRRSEFEAYLKNLNVTLQQCRVYSEKYISPPPSTELERATVVLATPPCSYIGVKDIVDLAIARGGDIDLLESIANTDNDTEQPRALLAEQLATLKYALTRPNVQLLIYEVHTVLPSETTEMIQQVVDYANRMAKEKYIRDNMPRKRGQSKDAEGKTNSAKKSNKFIQNQAKNRRKESMSSIDQDKNDDENANKEMVDDKKNQEIPSMRKEINVPNRDLFEIVNIHNIYKEGGIQVLEPGCFLTIVKRKETMQFDSLFMINVAESKGLFGNSKKEQYKKPNITVPIQSISQINRTKLKRGKIEIERLITPTHSSNLRIAHIEQDKPPIIMHNPSNPSPLPSSTAKDSDTSIKKLQVPQSSKSSIVTGNKHGDDQKRHLSSMNIADETVYPKHSRDFRNENMSYDLENKELQSRCQSIRYDESKLIAEAFASIGKKEFSDSYFNITRSKLGTTGKTLASSTILGEVALMRATRRASLIKVLEDKDKEYSFKIAGLSRNHVNFQESSTLRPDHFVSSNNEDIYEDLESKIDKQ